MKKKNPCREKIEGMMNVDTWYSIVIAERRWGGGSGRGILLCVTWTLHLLIYKTAVRLKGGRKINRF